MKTFAKRTVSALALIVALGVACEALAGNPYGGQWQGQMGGSQWQGQMGGAQWQGQMGGYGGYGYQPMIPTYNYNSNQNVNINVNRNYNGNYGYSYTPSYVYPRYHTVCRW
jgi:hypothetical protein